ncbi:IS5 family transposase [Ktedonobacter racemifer]|uniref:Transposase IS4 family protein n=1 Tax=Ktedonobacter racemifer DSM 44963 TaxID=485913 RepID=D6U778_KTERA|nr:IS5 family transposase [Ktedonobacter racemifer]EFH79739.1 transposase IS4 family protein [Ktedonobacter racemifer DSM 44963]
MNATYPSNLSDAEWECLQQHLPSDPSRGRPRTHALRVIFDAIFYVLRTGCAWRYLPCNFPPWQTVFYHFRRLRLKGTWFRLLTTLREAERERVGRNAQPSAAIIDAQSVKTVEESASICGFDAHKHIKGRKRHILVDTLSLLLSVYVTPADLHDSKGARCLLAGLAPLLPRLKKIWADAAYRGQKLAKFCLAQGNWDLEIVEHPAGTRGFSVQPRRWVVERTFGWLSRNRRLSKDYERKVQTSETLIQVAMIRLLLVRLGRKN